MTIVYREAHNIAAGINPAKKALMTDCCFLEHMI